MDDKLIEEMARALCAADGGRWRTRDEKPALGLPHDYDFDKLNDHWRHKAQACASILKKRIEGLEEWALEKSRLHHQYAVEDEHLRAEYIASSSAYRNLADEIAALSPVGVTEE